MENKVNRKNEKNYSMVSLFSGAGGMDLGFERAGFKTIFAVEYDEVFASTYIKNFPQNKMLIKDITQITNDEILELTRENKPDIIIGGPPCQGFSIAGNIGRTFLEDKRNYLFLEFVRFVKIIKPKIFVLENVATMATHLRGQTMQTIINEFKKIGYNTKHWLINTSDYSIPQERRRVFVVGTIYDVSFEFPKKHETPKVTIKEAIHDLPKLKSGQKSNVPNHNAMNHTKQMLEKMGYITDGGNRNLIPENIRPKSGDIRKYIKYDSTKPSYCVTGDMRKIFHYSQNRALTSRELARIQTFPDDFIFVGNSISVQQQIGNAVPPKISKIIATEIIKYLNERK